MRIVLVRLSALGDIVHTWPLADALCAARPHAHLTWIVEEPLRALVDGHPAVNAVLTVASRPWRRHPLATRTRMEIGSLRTRLRELQPDIALDPQGVLKSALVTRWSGAPRRVGLAHPWRRERLAGFAYSETVPGAPPGQHVVASNLELLRSLGIEPPAGQLPNGSWLLARVAPRVPTGNWHAPYAVVVPGTGGVHKALPTSILASVARGLGACGLEVVVAWGPGERNRAAEVADAGGSGAHLAPPTSLEELTALLGRAALIVGGDTGPVHLGASLSVPTLAVFLASDWRRNGPLGVSVAVVSGAEETRGGPTGSARSRPRRPVEPEEIIAAARNLLDAQARGGDDPLSRR